MSELINSLKTFAYSGSMSYDRRCSSGQLRIIPLLNLGGGGESGAVDTGFTQWRDAMRMVARLPGGLPPEFRLKLWENLSQKYLQENGILWARVLAKSATTQPRDQEIADQIHKDLHRTGCTGFSGAKQAKLQRVLVSYARWNPSVGYCQGFNMIGAMLLEMTAGDETLTLKVLIFLIEGVLPQGYFSGGLRGLAVDMAVFRQVLRMRKPWLSAHLATLQGGDENPPLIDVFTMHWFLTLFIHCLPTPSVLRIWDLVLLEGSEVLLRTALVLWAAIEARILGVPTADEFYGVMGEVTREMLEQGLMDPNSLVKCIVSVGPFPFPGLDEMRGRHRGLIQGDHHAPYKSFFLAKRELDNLKKHYAAIRHRQRATTIILKGLEVSRMRVPGQRSNSLFMPTTKKQMVSPKPKLRRGSSGSKSSQPNNNNRPENANSNNNNESVTTSASANNKTVANNLKNGAANGSVLGQTPKNKQGMNGCGASPRSGPSSRLGKSFRRRRTLSASSVTTTSSSSDTELCDSSESSSSSSSSSSSVWDHTENAWVRKSTTPTKKPKKERLKSARRRSLSKNSSTERPEKSSKKSGSRSRENSQSSSQQQVDSPGGASGQASLEVVEPFETPSSPGTSEPGSSSGGRTPAGTPALIVRSSSIIDTNDSAHFLDEMSKLGKSDSFYENLSKRICELQFQNLKTLSSCTTQIDPKSLTLPPFEKSPLPSPMSSFPPANELSSSSPLGLLDSEELCTRVSTFSPRQSSGESPFVPSSLPKGESGVKGREPYFMISGRTSKGSLSSLDIPDICIISDRTGEGAPALRPAQLDCETEPPSCSPPSPESVDEFPSNVQFGCGGLSECVTTPSSPQKSSMKLDLLDNYCLVSHKSPNPPPRRKSPLLRSPAEDASQESAEGSGALQILEDEEEELSLLPPRPKNCPPSPAEPSAFLRAHQREIISSSHQPKEEEEEEEEEGGLIGSNEEEGVSFPVATCPCQCETSEEINAVIRQNIAILERLKFNKPAYFHDDDEDEGEGKDADDLDEQSYEDLSSSNEDVLDPEPDCSLSLGEEPRKEPLSSLSSNASTGSGLRRNSASGGRGRLHRTSSQGSAKSVRKCSKQGSFNPFPTVRKATLRVTKYGLYN